MKDTTTFTILTFIIGLLACNSSVKTKTEIKQVKEEAVEYVAETNGAAREEISEGEGKPVFIFQNLKIVDTVFKENIIKTIKKKDKVNSNCFFTEEYQNSRGLFLFCKNPNFWLVYDFNDVLSNTSLATHSSLSARYVTVSVDVQRSGMGINRYGWVVLIDIIDKKYLYLDEFTYNSDDDGKNVGEVRCNTSITLNKGKFIIYSKSNQPKNNSEYCIEPGLYQIKKDTLAKIGEYIFPPPAIRNLVGKTLKDLKKIYPHSKLKEAPLYEYGDESNEVGYEVWNNGELLFFVTISNLKANGPITGLTIVSPKFKIGNINTKMTAKQVFKMYPNSTPHIDEISMHEYVYVKELDLTLVFKTNEIERVGVYEHKDGSDSFKSLNNKNAMVDLVMITK